MRPLANINPEPDDRGAVAAAVRAHLAIANISDTRAGALIGLAQSTMSRRTNGQHPFDIDELGRLAQALNMTLVELISMPLGYDPQKITKSTLSFAQVTDIHSRLTA